MSDNLDFNRAIAQTVLEYGEFKVDFSQLPPHVLIEAARRGLIHVLSNEALSKAGGLADKAVAAGEVAQDDRDAKRDELADKARAEYITRFYDGTWGTGRRASVGPRLDALETEYQRILAKTVRTWITNKKLAYDKDTKTWSWMSATGKQTRTIEQAIAGYESRMKPEEKDAMMAAAQETVDYKKRQAAALKGVGTTVEDEEMGI